MNTRHNQYRYLIISVQNVYWEFCGSLIERSKKWQDDIDEVENAGLKRRGVLDQLLSIGNREKLFVVIDCCERYGGDDFDNEHASNRLEESNKENNCEYRYLVTSLDVKDNTGIVMEWGLNWHSDYRRTKQEGAVALDYLKRTRRWNWFKPHVVTECRVFS